jgi:hypothetical protein
MKGNEIEFTENSGMEFFDTLLGIAKQAATTPQSPNSFCINRSRTINHINVEIHIENQPKPGLLRRLFSKFF